jgi:hypothetical protein
MTTWRTDWLTDQLMGDWLSDWPADSLWLTRLTYSMVLGLPKHNHLFSPLEQKLNYFSCDHLQWKPKALFLELISARKRYVDSKVFWRWCTTLRDYWIFFFGLCPSYGILKVQCLKLALPNGPNRIGISHPLTWGLKQIQFPKRCVLWNTGRWIKSKNPVIPKRYVDHSLLQIEADVFSQEKYLHLCFRFIPNQRIISVSLTA